MFPKPPFYMVIICSTPCNVIPVQISVFKSLVSTKRVQPAPGVLVWHSANDASWLRCLLAFSATEKGVEGVVKCLVGRKEAEWGWREVLSTRVPASDLQFQFEVHIVAYSCNRGFAQRVAGQIKHLSKLLRWQFLSLNVSKVAERENHVGASIGFPLGGSIISTNLQ